MSIFYLLPKGSAPYQYWLPYWLRKSFNCSQVPKTCHSNLPQLKFHLAICPERMFTCSVSSHGTEVQRQQREGRHNTTTQLHHNLITFCLVTTTTTIGTAFCDQVMLWTLLLGHWGSTTQTQTPITFWFQSRRKIRSSCWSNFYSNLWMWDGRFCCFWDYGEEKFSIGAINNFFYFQQVKLLKMEVEKEGSWK